MSITRRMDEFIERTVLETGIDRSNLIRTWIWERMQEERDRQLAERQVAERRRKP